MHSATFSKGRGLAEGPRRIRRFTSGPFCQRGPVPLNWIAVGNPARILPPDQHDEIWAVQKQLDFPRYVFGVDRPAEGQSIMPDVVPRYAAALRRWHKDDVEVTGAMYDR